MVVSRGLHVEFICLSPALLVVLLYACTLLCSFTLIMQFQKFREPILSLGPKFGRRHPSHGLRFPLIVGVTFSSTASATDPCRPCSICPRQLPIRDSCTATRDTICATSCPRGHYLAPGNGTQPRGSCVPCRVCKEGYGAVQECKPGSDTTCQKCPENYYSEVKSPYEPCLLCRRECGPKEVMIQSCTALSDTLCMGTSMRHGKKLDGWGRGRILPENSVGGGGHVLFGRDLVDPADPFHQRLRLHLLAAVPSRL